jgi:hypothetical protein
MRFKFGFAAPTHTDISFKERAQVPFLIDFFGVYLRELFYQHLCGGNNADPHWEHLSIPTPHKRATGASKRNFQRNSCSSEPHLSEYQGHWLTF